MLLSPLKGLFSVLSVAECFSVSQLSLSLSGTQTICNVLHMVNDGSVLATGAEADQKYVDSIVVRYGLVRFIYQLAEHAMLSSRYNWANRESSSYAYKKRRTRAATYDFPTRLVLE